MNETIALYLTSDKTFQLKEGSSYKAILSEIRGEILWVELGHVAGGHFYFKNKVEGYTFRLFQNNEGYASLVFENSNAKFISPNSSIDIDFSLLEDISFRDSLGVEVEFYENDIKIDLNWFVTALDRKFDIEDFKDDISHEIN